jgi:hypothetical protein
MSSPITSAETRKSMPNSRTTARIRCSWTLRLRSLSTSGLVRGAAPTGDVHPRRSTLTNTASSMPPVERDAKENGPPALSL